MANDNKLLSFIVDDGHLQAKNISEQAQKKREEILNNASLKAQENAREIEDAAEKKAQSLKIIASSNASLVSRNTVLKAKRAEIDKTVEGIKQYILTLDDESYFGILYRLAKTVSSKKGEILLNERDLKRIPDGFEKRLADIGIDAKICDTPVDISGGFILRDGAVEINCSIDSVIDDKQNEIEDFINKSIFE